MQRHRQVQDKDWVWKALKGGKCFPQSVLETGQGFGRCCQEMPRQYVSSSACSTMWTNLAASVSYLATALLQCGPLLQARIKLSYPGLNSLWRNHLGVIPVWSQPRTVEHIVALAMNVTQSKPAHGWYIGKGWRAGFMVCGEADTGPTLNVRYKEICSLQGGPLRRREPIQCGDRISHRPSKYSNVNTHTKFF